LVKALIEFHHSVNRLIEGVHKTREEHLSNQHVYGDKNALEAVLGMQVPEPDSGYRCEGVIEL
jgi:hypothetical protein